jgi:hypothetical protein
MLPQAAFAGGSPGASLTARPQVHAGPLSAANRGGCSARGSFLLAADAAGACPSAPAALTAAQPCNPGLAPLTRAPLPPRPPTHAPAALAKAADAALQAAAFNLALPCVDVMACGSFDDDLMTVLELGLIDL